MASKQDIVGPPTTRHPMACPGLDPRSGTMCASCFSNKMTSYVLGYLQTILWIMALIGLASAPQYLKAAEVASAVIFGLLALGFSILLVIGLHTNRRSYIKIYLIFCAVLTIFCIIGTFLMLFTTPSKLGFKGFMSNFIVIALNITTFIAVRCYYITAFS